MLGRGCRTQSGHVEALKTLRYKIPWPFFLTGKPPALTLMNRRKSHVYLNSVQQMVSGELAGEGLQRGLSRHGLPPQRAPLDTVYPLREHLNSVQGMVFGGYCEGLLPDTVCWTRLRNTWKSAINPEIAFINVC